MEGLIMRHKDLFINKWQKRRGWLPVILITAALALSGCGEAQAVETGATGAKLSEQTTETTLAKSSETITDTADPSSVLLPENMTMDDLRNILVVNGETLTLPTSLNKLMDMDEDFSYEAQYVDEKSPLYNGKQKGFVFDIFYKDDWLVTASLPTDKKDVSAVLDDDVYHMSFNKMDCEETGMQAGLSCNLGFGSSLEEIEKIFGEPNVFTVDTTNKDYEFYDKDYKCKLSFEINSYNDNLVSWFSISIFPKTSKKEFETTYEITEWSPDDFRTVQCCGIDITVPCKLSDIDSRFETKIIKGEVTDSTDSTFVELYYDGEYVGTLSYGKDNVDIEKDCLSLMMLTKFSINGLTDASTKKDVQMMFGVGNNINNEFTDSYYGNNTMVLFQYFSESGTELCICFYEEE